MRKEAPKKAPAKAPVSRPAPAQPHDCLADLEALRDAARAQSGADDKERYHWVTLASEIDTLIRTQRTVKGLRNERVTVDG